MKVIFAVDPGNVQSAYCVLEDGRPTNEFGIIDNESMLDLIYHFHKICFLAIEQIQSYGMAVGKTIFETCVWSGRFIEAHNIMNEHDNKFIQIPRKDVKLHLCGSVRAKDTNIRQALIDRFGPPGTKKEPGLTYGFKRDIWAALAVGVTYYDTI